VLAADSPKTPPPIPAFFSKIFSISLSRFAFGFHLVALAH
jgi:hypothetical protein